MFALSAQSQVRRVVSKCSESKGKENDLKVRSDIAINRTKSRISLSNDKVKSVIKTVCRKRDMLS